MNAKAFILVNVEPAQTLAVSERLQAIRGAVVYEIMGPYDLIVDIEADTPEDLTSILRSKIRSVPGVTGTVTCLVQGSWASGAASAPG